MLKSKILAFAHMQPLHTGNDLSLKVLGIFIRLGNIEKNILY